eukprot:s1458_g12.t1
MLGEVTLIQRYPTCFAASPEDTPSSSIEHPVSGIHHSKRCIRFDDSPSEARPPRSMTSPANERGQGLELLRLEGGLRRLGLRESAQPVAVGEEKLEDFETYSHIPQIPGYRNFRPCVDQGSVFRMLSLLLLARLSMAKLKKKVAHQRLKLPSPAQIAKKGKCLGASLARQPVATSWGCSSAARRSSLCVPSSGAASLGADPSCGWLAADVSSTSLCGLRPTRVVPAALHLHQRRNLRLHGGGAEGATTSSAKIGQASGKAVATFARCPVADTHHPIFAASGRTMASAGMLGLLSGFGLLIMESARHMQDHWDVYQKGADQLTKDLLSLFSKVPENFKKQYQEASADMVKSTQDLFYSLLGNIVNNVSSLIFGVLLTMLYTLFWLCSPVPMDSSVDVMFRKYIMFKTLACFGYGISAGLLLYFLSIDLASVFALTTFALNFVPEVGPFIAMVLPCPVILFDSRLERPMLTLLTAVIGQLALKFSFSNIIEVKLIESDKKLRMHPVMILLSVGIFGYLWGPTGMLLSVPLMALMKIALFSELVPSSYRDPILVILEGDRSAPQKHGLKASSKKAPKALESWCSPWWMSWSRFISKSDVQSRMDFSGLQLQMLCHTLCASLDAFVGLVELHFVDFGMLFECWRKLVLPTGFGFKACMHSLLHDERVPANLVCAASCAFPCFWLCTRKLQKDELMLNQMKHFDVRSAECTVASDRIVIQEQIVNLFDEALEPPVQVPFGTVADAPDAPLMSPEALRDIRDITSYPTHDEILDQFNAYVRGPLRESVEASMGKEEYLPLNSCIAAQLPAIFCGFMIALGCDGQADCEMSASNLGFASVTEYMIVNMFGCAVQIPLTWILSLPLVLRTTHLVTRAMSSGIWQNLAGASLTGLVLATCLCGISLQYVLLIVVITKYSTICLGAYVACFAIEFWAVWFCFFRTSARRSSRCFAVSAPTP